MQDIKQFLSNLTHHPGIYQMLGGNGEVLYVGKAKDLKKRVSSYFASSAKDAKTLSLLEQIKSIETTITHNESEAVLLECNLIKKHHPRYNTLLRDDKSYPYILITIHHVYPRIDLYRGPRKKNGLYFGPYPSASAVRETISLLQKIFRIRTCRDSFFETRLRPCLLHQIDRCTGPCVRLITKEEYAKNVQMAILFLEGKSDELIVKLEKNMEQAAAALDFERAAHYRDQMARLRHMQTAQHINVSHINADVIGMAINADVVCIQLLSFRNGQMLDTRSYFPSVPAHTTPEEVINAFISQHYFGHQSHIESIPQQIILACDLEEKTLLQNALTMISKHKVELIKPIRGEKKKWLAMATTNAKQSLNVYLSNKSKLSERLLALQQVLGVTGLLHRIECFDISHSTGEATVASCVVFNENGPSKSEYRRFNITGITPGDDVSAMHQVLKRRFKRLQTEGARLPELILIDGGPTQLRAAQKALEELGITAVVMLGVSKGKDRKAGFETLYLLALQSGLLQTETPIPKRFHLPADDLALHVIQQIRDEAHRFAITGHRMRRDKIRRQSSLENIPGIGVKRRRELLRYFGGIQGIARASLEELSKVPGISRSLAERIFAILHDAAI